jgi:L-lactate dehydrogenase (cytochrome)
MTVASRRVSSPQVVNVEDLRKLARNRLPRVVFDYLDGGAENEITLLNNQRAFDAVTFRPKNAVSVPQCELGTKVLGHQLSFPGLLPSQALIRLQFGSLWIQVGNYLK